MFRKTRHHRVFQDLVEQIQAAIVEGRLKPGDRLPPQRELVAMFQTSRASIREALRVLEHKGLIEIKLGVSGGAVVKVAGTEPITDVLTLLMRQKRVSLEHLVEFRETIEGRVAALAAARATRDDIAKLEDILKQAASALERADAGPYDFIRMDIRMHIALAEIAANPVFAAVVRMVHETVLGHDDRFTVQEPEALAENHRDLQALVAAVKAGRGDEAQRLASAHVRRFKRRLHNTQTGARRRRDHEPRMPEA